MKKSDKQDRRRFLLLTLLVVLAGCFFLIWGQNNSAETLYELGFLRYRAENQLANTPEWGLSEEEEALREASLARAEAWLAEHAPAEGSWDTETAAGMLGEGVRLTLPYRYWDRGTGKTVILLHGFGGSEEDALAWAPWWWEQGYGILIPTQRGYQSPGETNTRPTTWGVYEQFDLYDLIQAAGLSEETVLIHAKGAGAAGAILLAGNEELRGAGLDGIVAESSFCRLGELQRRLLKRLFNLGDRFVGVLLREKVKQRLGYLLDSVDLSEAAAAASVPALFVSGGQETLPGFAESQAVQDAWGGSSRLLLLSGSYRALGLTEGDAYRAAILELFKEEA